MNNNTILSWDDVDYKAIYTSQIKNNPIYWNDDINAWVVYSYEFCKAILLNNDAQIPEPLIDSTLNNKAKLLINKLARLSNNSQHQDAREAALQIFDSMKSVSIAELLASLLIGQKREEGFDWVSVVAKKLPVLVVLKGLCFNDDDCVFVTENIASLVKIMSPAKTEADIAVINNVVDEFYAIAEKQIILSSSNKNQRAEAVELLICNLIGLFIQSYDAGRGLLTNALLNMVNYHKYLKMNSTDINKMVIETLRFDPPVHNTRRVATKNIVIGDRLIKAGDAILIIMAAANLDTAVFTDPLTYTIDRANNNQHLTFGLGGHNCLAKYFSIDLAVQSCDYLVANYNKIKIIQNEFKYELQLNVRLVKELMINLL